MDLSDRSMYFGRVYWAVPTRSRRAILQERLCASALPSGDLHSANDGKCTFTAGGDDHTIDVSIGDDTKAVVISTVVHKGKHAYKTHRQSEASYFPMTC